MNAETVLAIIPVGADGSWFVRCPDGKHRRLSGWALVRIVVDDPDGDDFEVVRGICPGFDPGFEDGLVSLDECVPGDELDCVIRGRCQGHLQPATAPRLIRAAS